MPPQKSSPKRRSLRRSDASNNFLWVSRGLAGALALLSLVGFLGLISLDGVVSGAVGVAFTRIASPIAIDVGLGRIANQRTVVVTACRCTAGTRAVTRCATAVAIIQNSIVVIVDVTGITLTISVRV